jgi:hypothetical protein
MTVPLKAAEIVAANPKLTAHLRAANHAPALDLANMRGPGQRSPQTLLLLDERDVLLREVAERFFLDTSDREIARTLHAALTRYACTAWQQRERTELTCPRRHDGTIRAFYWRILRTIDHVPSERTIRRALGVRGPPSALYCYVNIKPLKR